MKMRSAFTLMELMVSSVLIVMITLFLYSAIGSMKLSNDRLALHNQNEANRTKVFELLYRDFVEAVDINISKTDSDKYSLVKLQTHNSLHRIAMPHVVYFVHTKTNSLTRLESASEISLPLDFEETNVIAVDVVLNDVSSFNIYQNNNVDTNTTDANSSLVMSSVAGTLLVYIAEKNREPMIFELSI